MRMTLRGKRLYVLRLNHEFQFPSQAQYLVKFEDDTCWPYCTKAFHVLAFKPFYFIICCGSL